MHELTCLSLENDMDLILAYRHGMKLAEIAGLSLSKQTSFATAVSEVCRDIIVNDCNGELRLGIDREKDGTKELVALVSCNRSREDSEGRRYAGRLVDRVKVSEGSDRSDIYLVAKLPGTTVVNEKAIERWTILLNNDPAITPYEEIKRKNKELEQLAEKLRQSELQYKLLTDSLPLMIFTLNNEAEITYANKWMQEYTGKSVAQLNDVKWRSVLHPDEFDAAWTEWDAGLAGVLTRKTERRLMSKEGEYRWHAGVTIPVKTDDGKVTGFNAFLVDVDAQKKIEQALKDNQELKEMKLELEAKVKELNQSNEELEQFAYVASHDLQEPLRKISFYSDYLQTKYGEQLPAEARYFLDNIGSASTRMKTLIHDVLVYSTISSDKGFTRVDLSAMMQETIQDHEFTIREKHASVSYDHLPWIDGVPVQLKQLFENLLSNALKFTDPSRQPIVKVTSVMTGGTVEIRFTDNGIGFDQQYLDKMFDLFQRLHTREKYEGTGIGLGICKKIAMLHGGEITATGVPGKGATFAVKLPLKQDKQ